jgi:hypothetical protein
MVKMRHVLVVFMAALPVTVVAGATYATASESSYQGTGALDGIDVGSEEGVSANLRYPDGSTAF